MNRWIARLMVGAAAVGMGIDPSYAKDSASDVLVAKFKALDKNGDGKISKEEFLASATTTGKGKKQMTPEQQFKAFDKDGDGFISPTEFANNQPKK